MEKLYLRKTDKHFIRLIIFLILLVKTNSITAQTVTAPQVNFTQRTSSATPSKVIYNIKGDFTMLGNTNLTLNNYSSTTNNEGNLMKYVDIDGDDTTLNSSMATLEVSNSGENSASQNCSKVLFAGLYWTGKSDDTDTFTVSKQVQNGTVAVNNDSNFSNAQNITNTNYTLNIKQENGGGNSNRYPSYAFSGNNTTYVFSYTNSGTVILSINGVTATNIPVTITTGTTNTATLNTPYTITDGAVTLTVKKLTRDPATTNSTTFQIAASNYASVNVSGNAPTYTTATKNYNKKVISIKGPNATAYTSITAKPNGATSNILFPGAAYSGIFVGYQEVTDYVKTHGPGAYTVADIALTEGTNNNPGLSGGWVMIVIYENPIMKSRAVTLFDGYAYVNGQRGGGGGEFGNIPISGFTTVGAGPVNMKLGVMAAEGDVGATSGSDYLAVQKLTADTNKTYDSTNYLTLNHSGNTTNNFFNSSIFPVPAAGKSDPISQNNTGVDFSMFTIPNSNNSVIGNNQTATTFRFGSTYEVYTIFGFAMSVDAYIPEPQGVIVVNTIAGITPASPLTASPGDEIEYKIDIKNRGSEATKNTIITIPIPASAWYTVSSILTSNIHSSFTPANAPYYDDGTKSIIWNVGALPLLVDPNTLLASLSFKVKLTTDCATLFNSGCNSSIALNGAITGNGAISNSSFSTAISQGIDPNSACGGLIDKPILVNFNSSNSPCFTALAGPDKTPAVCGLEAVTLGATEGTSGTWSIVSGPSGGVFSNASSPNSEFSSPNTGIYTLRWTIPNGGGSCAPIIDDAQVSIGLCNKLDFDGIDDNVNFNDNFNLSNGAFSIEVWIKPNAANTNIQTILSKRNSTVLSDGYDLRLMNNTLSFNWNNGNSITSNFPISVNRWYHVAVTYDGTSYKLYIDGVSVQVAVAGSNPIANSDAKCILGAMIQSNTYPYLPTNFFTGWMQELRIWNVALTEAQTRQMMNQKIENNSSNVFGSIVPIIIPGLNWGNLQGYYPMIQSSDIINGTLIDKTNNNRNGKLIGIVTAQPETAPLPYTSSTNSAWETNSTWTYGNVWNIPNTLAVDNTTFIDWNIIKTNNNITTIGNKTVLGLLVESNTLGANNDNKIEISHYLKLDGKIDLVGRSQLVQTEGSILDTASSGYIERDQQGQSNKFNYNYWSSPVSPINTTTNNTDYTIADVMKDGTTSTPQNLKWIGGYDGSPTSPISLARYWVYKFDNYSNAYANWTRIGETGTVRVGQGYTLKGSGATSNTQNYTFVGKPNNGLISTNTISPNQLLLAGNPYPSALDSDAFIQDNLNTIDSNTSDVTNGTLYFWEHYSSNNTHVLRDYQGGYAVRNLTGGIAPSSANVDFISKAGTPSGGIPSRYIPVGQGFFVGGRPNSTTSTLIFKNSQRTFVKENDSSNVLYKMKETKKETWKNNNSDIIFEDNIKRIRLGFNSRNDYHKQLLLGFMNEKATDGIDYGYDGTSFDNLPNDIYFLTNESELIIQGVGYFNASASYPIGVKTDALGTVKFMLDGVENFDQNQNIFIYDSENDSYNDIRNNTYEVTLPAGQNKTRFSLRFTDKKLAIKEEIIDTTNIIINHSRNYNRLIINNYSLDLTVQKVVLYNSTGQIINTWKTENQSQQNIQLPIQKINSGIYIARIQTSKGDLSKKIIIP